jgi:cytochrome c biogenesis protein CcmG/thiol:disulfide interchange protein DsbE
MILGRGVRSHLWWKLGLMLLPAVALIVLLAFGFTRDPSRIDSPLIGRPAADFRLELLDGGTLKLSDLRGRPVVVNFWASWCYPACWNEAPRLEAAWQRYRDRGVMVVGVVYQDTAENAREFIRTHGKTYPNGLDPAGRVALDYGVYGVPETFFIDRQGVIADKHIGEIHMETLTAKIDALLAASQARAGQE